MSRISTSLENLDNTRPTGVVSKNSSGNLNTFCNKEKCNATAAFNAPKNGVKSLMNAVIAVMMNLNIDF